MDLIELQKNFVNYGFGMFIHFNSATFQFHTGPVADWEHAYENENAPRIGKFDPRDWRPEQLDCTQWAKTAKKAGVKFSALTAKHHEGFNLWPSEYTGHSVKNAPIQTDVVKEYLTAFRAQGIAAGLYFSLLDLAHDIRKIKCTPEDKIFIKNQIEELLTNYGEIPFLIIDGWNAPWGGPRYTDFPFQELDSFVKGLQPNCLLMNIGETQNVENTDIVFFENAAGQTIENNFQGPGCGCNIFTKHWFWRADDPLAELKSAKWALEFLQDCNSKNASFLLNASPNTRGLMDDNLRQRFEALENMDTDMVPVTATPENWKVR